jgi:hypothetical protein
VIRNCLSFHFLQAAVQASNVFFFFCLVLITKLQYVSWEQCVGWNETLADSQQFRLCNSILQ